MWREGFRKSFLRIELIKFDIMMTVDREDYFGLHSFSIEWQLVNAALALLGTL